MARLCTVCNHPNRDGIEVALLRGTSIRDVAGQHDLRKSAVDRHRSHIGTVPRGTGAIETSAAVTEAEDFRSAGRDETLVLGSSARLLPDPAQATLQAERRALGLRVKQAPCSAATARKS